MSPSPYTPATQWPAVTTTRLETRVPVQNDASSRTSATTAGSPVTGVPLVTGRYACSGASAEGAQAASTAARRRPLRELIAPPRAIVEIDALAERERQLEADL